MAARFRLRGGLREIAGRRIGPTAGPCSAWANVTRPSARPRSTRLPTAADVGSSGSRFRGTTGSRRAAAADPSQNRGAASGGDRLPRRRHVARAVCRPGRFGKAARVVGGPRRPRRGGLCCAVDRTAARTIRTARRRRAKTAARSSIGWATSSAGPCRGWTCKTRSPRSTTLESGPTSIRADRPAGHRPRRDDGPVRGGDRSRAFGRTVVAGYFQSRDRCWEEPVDRRLPGQLLEFGDAELAALMAPRFLGIVSASGCAGRQGRPRRRSPPRRGLLRPSRTDRPGWSISAALPTQTLSRGQPRSWRSPSERQGNVGWAERGVPEEQAAQSPRSAFRGAAPLSARPDRGQRGRSGSGDGAWHRARPPSFPRIKAAMLDEYRQAGGRSEDGRHAASAAIGVGPDGREVQGVPRDARRDRGGRGLRQSARPARHQGARCRRSSASTA